ncbi:gamma-glutamylputrescine oxidase [Breoghania corrubedonensis]|uniref:Gamma-glutamylputrescine oxidase n=1 Tax=Breoghania corrubedonensis TaxID=665038 RepID=A0A2T5VF97_9HYPH|nr:FAD-binding oxidoreductase [Breoghania corrubedonensis]PTW62424.1 gamma-glutamylputrescine oxidase [Breoghania corrubedonensis]
MSVPPYDPACYYTATINDDRPRPVLAERLTADVCVIGGGFTGVSAALHLAEQGFSVILCEEKRIGWGASGRNGGQLHSGQRRDQHWLESHVGKAQARLFWDMAEEAKTLIKDRIARHAIDCDWADGLIHAVHKKAWLADEQREAEQLARDYGYDAIKLLDRDQLAAAIGTDAYFGGYRDAEAGHLHPLNFVLGMARAAEEAGTRIFEGTRVTDIGTGQPITITTEKGEVRATHVVLAANGYLEGLEPATEARVLPINNYILASEPLGERDPIPGNEAVADSRWVVHYWRMSPDRRLIFGGGETYSRRYPANVASFVRRHMAKIYPQFADARIDHAWGGTLAITANRMPYFRRPRSGLYVACGFSGHGVGIANLAGRLIGEAVAGDAGRFDTFAQLPMMAFPGGKWLRTPIQALAMTWFALRDRM